MSSRKSTARRSQTERKAESDRKMMLSALELIARKGSTGISMAEIGVNAGYSSGLPAGRYGSKLAMLEAVVDFSEKWLHETMLKKAVQDKRGLEAVKARIGAHLDGARDTSVATIALFQLYMESLGTVVELRPRIIALSNEYKAGFKKHLYEAVEMGEIDPDCDLDQLAKFILGAMRGVAIQALIDGRTAELEAAKAFLFDVLFKTFARPMEGDGKPQGRNVEEG